MCVTEGLGGAMTLLQELVRSHYRQGQQYLVLCGIDEVARATKSAVSST